MILDNQTLFSDAQAITASAASTNIIDLGPIAVGVVRDIGKGVKIPVLLQVVEAFAAAGAGTLTFALEVDDNSSFSSPKVVATTPAIGKAALVPGYQVNLDYIPRGTDEKFMRLNYTVATGPMTAGKVTAGVMLGGHQTNG
ncbi:Bbp16 family capsid cement protein [Hyphomicrobium sp. ghe19]|uniref:Bbp16 family capsid cement protein n=1 Tax=Hyphomicrobium sp. ghe19 TaxID=2682968 RepID=UPI0013679316|nr:hypothetical protein HYPP_01948 [Hyphomicrobium sp. ghe19]